MLHQAMALVEHRKRPNTEGPVGADYGFHLSATPLLKVSAAAFWKGPDSALVHSVGALDTPAAAVQLVAQHVIVPVGLHLPVRAGKRRSGPNCQR